jgi:hypothetical protein
MVSKNHEIRVFLTNTPVMLIGWCVGLLSGALAIGLFYFAFWGATGDTPIWARVMVLVFSGVLLLVASLGLWFSLGGERIAIHRDRAEIRIARGRWLIWQRESIPLNGFTSVRCTSQVASMAGDHATSQSYPISLCGPGNELEVAAPGTYSRARQVGEALAQWLGWEFEDATGGESIRRSADDLDQSLAERIGKTNQPPTLRWPKQTKLERSHQGDVTIIRLPALTRKQLFEGVLSILFLTAIYGGSFGLILYGIWNTAGQNSWSTALMPWLGGILILPVLWILILGVGILIMREEVRVSTRGVKRRWKFPIGSWTTTLRSAEIEEILEDGDEVLLRGDRRTLRLGFTLPKAERRLLRQAVMYYLIAGGIDPETKEQ